MSSERRVGVRGAVSAVALVVGVAVVARWVLAPPRDELPVAAPTVVSTALTGEKSPEPSLVPPAPAAVPELAAAPAPKSFGENPDGWLARFDDRMGYEQPKDPLRTEDWEDLACEKLARKIRPLRETESVLKNLESQRLQTAFDSGVDRAERLMVQAGQLSPDKIEDRERTTPFGLIPRGIDCPQETLRRYVGGKYLDRYLLYLLQHPNEQGIRPTFSR